MDRIGNSRETSKIYSATANLSEKNSNDNKLKNKDNISTSTFKPSEKSFDDRLKGAFSVLKDKTVDQSSKGMLNNELDKMQRETNSQKELSQLTKRNICNKYSLNI